MPRFRPGSGKAQSWAARAYEGVIVADDAQLVKGSVTSRYSKIHVAQKLPKRISSPRRPWGEPDFQIRPIKKCTPTEPASSVRCMQATLSMDSTRGSMDRFRRLFGRCLMWTMPEG
jgi:hypothetical protein